MLVKNKVIATAPGALILCLKWTLNNKPENADKFRRIKQRYLQKEDAKKIQFFVDSINQCCVNAL